MSTFKTDGTQYRYLRNDNICTVMADYPDRRMVRIKMDNGQELDEVNYHDLVLLEPEVPTSPVVETTEESETVAEVDDEEDKPRPRWGRA